MIHYKCTCTYELRYIQYKYTGSNTYTSTCTYIHTYTYAQVCSERVDHVQ